MFLPNTRVLHGERKKLTRITIETARRVTEKLEFEITPNLRLHIMQDEPEYLIADEEWAYVVGAQDK